MGYLWVFVSLNSVKVRYTETISNEAFPEVALAR